MTVIPSPHHPYTDTAGRRLVSRLWQALSAKIYLPCEQRVQRKTAAFGEDFRLWNL
jgi:hypothetical protein